MTLRASFISPIAVLVIGGARPAAATAVQEAQVGRNVLVSTDAPTSPHVEPHLAVDPTDPMHLLGAAMRVDPSGDVAVIAYTSFDGGGEWYRHRFPSCGFDPWVAFGPGGTAYLSCLSSGDVARVLVYRSDRGERTWRGGVEVPRRHGTGLDHPSIIAGAMGDDGAAPVHVVAMYGIRLEDGGVLSYPVVFSSDDGGLTFAPPVSVLVTNVWANPLGPVSLSDGALGFAYMDFAVDNGAGGKAVSTPRAWWVVSTDGGRTFSLPSLIAEPKGWTTLPVIAVDASDGPYRDRLYLAVDVVRDGRPELEVYHSAGRGRTWSEPVDVLVDRVGGAANPVVAVNAAGVLGVAYYAAEGVPDRHCWTVQFSASVDGGESFATGVPVSDAPFCTDVPGNVVSRPGKRPFDVARRWPAGGDYFGLAAGNDGRFHVLWSDTRTGVYQLWTAPVTVTEH